MITLITLTAIVFVIIFIATAIATANDELSFSLPVKAYAIRRNARNTFSSLNDSMAPVYAQQRNELAQAELSERCAKAWAKLNTEMAIAQFEAIAPNREELTQVFAEPVNESCHGDDEEELFLDARNEIRATITGLTEEDFTAMLTAEQLAEYLADEEPAIEPAIEPLVLGKRFSCKRLKWAKECAATQTELGYNVEIIKLGNTWYVKDVNEKAHPKAQAEELIINGLSKLFPSLHGLELKTAINNWIMSNITRYDILKEWALATVTKDYALAQKIKEEHSEYMDAALAA